MTDRLFAEARACIIALENLYLHSWLLRLRPQRRRRIIVRTLPAALRRAHRRARRLTEENCR